MKRLRLTDKSGGGALLSFFPKSVLSNFCIACTSVRMGFTLAEVLITLGIIGVIAAMTIPVMISKHEKHIIEVGLKKTYSDLYNLIKRSELDNGSYEEWDYSNYDKFMDTYIKPYINLKRCDSHNGKQNAKMHCFAGSDGNFYIWRYPVNKNMVLNANYIAGNYRVSPKYLLIDGRSIMFNVTKNSPRVYVEFVVDVNGQRGKSVMGEDVFTFILQYRSDRAAKYSGFFTGFSDAHLWDKNGVYSNCHNNVGSYSCSVILQRNGWKFPKDYPIKF